MIKSNYIAYLEKLTDAELWFTFEASNNHCIECYGEIASLILLKVENEVKTQLDLVKFMQQFNNLITTFQDALVDQLHILVVMNQRLERQRREAENTI